LAKKEHGNLGLTIRRVSLDFSTDERYNRTMTGLNNEVPRIQDFVALSARDRPARLMRIFFITSFISLAIIILLVGVSLHTIYSNHIIRNAEENAMNIGYAMFEQEKTFLVVSEGGKQRMNGVNDKIFPMLDLRMRNYLKSLNVLKAKFFDDRKKIVYSTDHSIIGKVDRENAALARALAGEVVSKILKKGSMLDLAGEQRFDVDVVETYFPIVTEEHEKIGAFEIYVDVSRAYSELRTVSRLSLGILAAVLVLVFGALNIIMQRLTKRLAGIQRDLERIAITDELTRIYNRGYLMARAQEEMTKMRRIRDKHETSAFTGFVLFDIDDFKKVNDRYGHMIGDEVLREVSIRVQEGVRTYDIFGRFGGEEFLVILPNTGCEETRVIAERIQQRLKQGPIATNDGSKLTITASFGLACYAGDDKSLQEILHRADERMYSAKRAGKDRIVCE
jgi:diguanylate cyclase (GGDEF)-like protein